MVSVQAQKTLPVGSLVGTPDGYTVWMFGNWVSLLERECVLLLENDLEPRGYIGANFAPGNDWPSYEILYVPCLQIVAQTQLPPPTKLIQRPGVGERFIWLGRSDGQHSTAPGTEVISIRCSDTRRVNFSHLGYFDWPLVPECENSFHALDQSAVSVSGTKPKPLCECGSGNDARGQGHSTWCPQWWGG